uniref:Uncharacterized protein n=1 Tax=Rhizophora mucronata TaxID=61149 RepID=A0A2P2K7X3_RHIMU
MRKKYVILFSFKGPVAIILQHPMTFLGVSNRKFLCLISIATTQCHPTISVTSQDIHYCTLWRIESIHQANNLIYWMIGNPYIKSVPIYIPMSGSSYNSTGSI